jgi:hypothetical protein
MAAKYAASPSSSREPFGGDYCLVVVVDAELALLVGVGDLSANAPLLSLANKSARAAGHR